MPNTLTDQNHSAIFNELAFGSTAYEHTEIPASVPLWTANAHYQIGDVVQPSTLAKATGLVYRCTALNGGSGMSASAVFASANTTGTISANSTTLTVVSATGLHVGDALQIAGAGPSGSALTTTISAISGTTVTLADKATTAVTNQQVLDLSPVQTTGSITSPNFTTLVVASATGLNVGDYIEIAGAGSGSGTLKTYIVGAEKQLFAGDGR